VMTMPEMVERIREVGFESTVLATDFGQTERPLPAEGMEIYVRGLLDGGFPQSAVRRMAQENASGLLGS